MHSRNLAVRIHEGDGLSKECGEPEAAAGGPQDSLRIGIVEKVAAEMMFPSGLATYGVEI